jgi:SAM-dependent methyltransferase
MFNQLPQEQFGFILAYNFFDNLSMNYIQKMLKECVDLLKPGGKMIFTFNDCDLPHNIDLVERGYKYYTPGRLVKHYLENTGFTVLKHFCESYGIAWFEIEKPGKLESIKGGQVLAKVHQKNIDKKYPPWKENNEGYKKRERVSWKGKNYEARNDLQPIHVFNDFQWKLVE